MSRAPAAALLCLLVPLGALASPAPKKRKPVAAPKGPSVDLVAFDQTYEYVFLQAGRSFLDGEPMPDPTILDQFLGSLQEPEKAKAQEKRSKIEGLISGAECVQDGPEAIPPEVYKLMVDEMAEKLRVGEIVETDFMPNGRAGRSLDADEKKLVATCQAEARNQAADRRGFYQRCLGRIVSEEVYLADARMTPAATDKTGTQACVLVLGEVSAKRERLPVDIKDKIGADLDVTRSALLEGLKRPETLPRSPFPPPIDSHMPGSSPFLDSRTFKRAPASNTTAAPVRKTDLATMGPPLENADLTTGAKLAAVVKRDEIGFTGYCYSYVKSALQKVGIVDKQTIANAGASAHAKLFNDFVEKNPGLMKRKLKKIAPAWPLPIGTVVVWSPSACNYSDVSGHIEIVTRIKPPQACSDGCGTFQVACLDELGAAPANAEAALPAAREALAQAQAAVDALKGSKNAKAVAAARTTLTQKKAAVAKLEKALTPRVNAYVVEREPAPIVAAK